MKHYTIDQINAMQQFAKDANDFLAHAWSFKVNNNAHINNWLERAQALPISFDVVDFNEFCEEEAINYEEFWQFYLAYSIQQCNILVNQYNETLQQLRTRNKIAGMRARATRQTSHLGA